ncbi:hypothetical protein JOC59_000311 [Weissella beninensis]|nr:hypothetical protein [Periweissella beninensis]
MVYLDNTVYLNGTSELIVKKQKGDTTTTLLVVIKLT